MEIYEEFKLSRITKDYVLQKLENNGVCLGPLDQILDDLLCFYKNNPEKLLRKYHILQDEDNITPGVETLTDLDIYYSGTDGIPIVKETLTTKEVFQDIKTKTSKYYTYKNNKLCEIDINDLQSNKNYNALYRFSEPKTKKFWDISNLEKYDIVALYIKSNYEPYTMLDNAIVSLCTDTYILGLYPVDIIKLNVSDENYIKLLNMAKNDKTFWIKHEELLKHD